MKLPSLFESSFKVKLLDIQQKVIDADGDFDFTIINERVSVISRNGFDFKQKVSNASALNLKATDWMHKYKSVNDMLRYFCLCHFSDYFSTIKNLSGYNLVAKPIEHYGTALSTFRCYLPDKTVVTGLLNYINGNQGLSFLFDNDVTDHYRSPMKGEVLGVPTPIELFDALIAEIKYH